MTGAPDPSANPDRGSPDVLHGGEPRPSQAEVAAGFAALRAGHPDLAAESGFLAALLAGGGRLVLGGGGGLAFHSQGACATIRYAAGGRHWQLTLEQEP